MLDAGQEARTVSTAMPAVGTPENRATACRLAVPAPAAQQLGFSSSLGGCQHFHRRPALQQRRALQHSLQVLLRGHWLALLAAYNKAEKNLAR